MTSVDMHFEMTSEMNFVNSFRVDFPRKVYILEIEFNIKILFTFEFYSQQ